MSFFSKTLSSWAADVLCVRHPWGTVGTPFLVGLGVFAGKAEVNVYLNGEHIPGLNMVSTRTGICRFKHWHMSDADEEQEIGAVCAPEHVMRSKEGVSDATGATVAPKMLDALPLVIGQNVLRYEVRQGQSKTTLSAFLYLWHNTDTVVVVDIDGTITRSDNRGHILTSLGVGYEHSGVCELMGRLSDVHRIVYLTGRPASSLDSTRDYISKLCQEGHRLPMGPMFTTKTGVLGAVISELAGEAASFKSSVLLHLRGLFRPDMQVMARMSGSESREGGSGEDRAAQALAEMQKNPYIRPETDEDEEEELEDDPRDRTMIVTTAGVAAKAAGAANGGGGMTPVKGGGERIADGADDGDELGETMPRGGASDRHSFSTVEATRKAVAARALFGAGGKGGNGRPTSLPAGKLTDEVFVAAFGNSAHDKEAYERVGVMKSHLFMIDKDSRICCGPQAAAGSDEKTVLYESYSGMMADLEKLFPMLKDDQQTFHSRSLHNSPRRSSQS